MSEERLFDAIGVIDDEYTASAARRLGYYIAPGPAAGTATRSAAH